MQFLANILNEKRAEIRTVASIIFKGFIEERRYPELHKLSTNSQEQCKFIVNNI